MSRNQGPGERPQRRLTKPEAAHCDLSQRRSGHGQLSDGGGSVVAREGGAGAEHRGSVGRGTALCVPTVVTASHIGQTKSGCVDAEHMRARG